MKDNVESSEYRFQILSSYPRFGMYWFDGINTIDCIYGKFMQAAED
jgi:hypothetical protein